MRRNSIIWRGIFLFSIVINSFCVAEQQDPDLTELEIEELLNIEITSVSKKEQNVSEASVAIFVISQADIRRSGATNIPEILRIVPGLNLAQIDSNKWAISSRGFNGRFANKLLVLIDGRTVYTPLFSGVYWEVQDTLLEDIERIEVIRGPGATLWGANAVNGVINIITKRSRVTQGTLLSSGAGTEEHGFGAARFGGKIDDQTHFRVYGKYFNRDESVFADDSKAFDDWRIARGGFRLDRDFLDGGALTLSGDLYNGSAGDLETVPDFSSPDLSQTLIGDADVSGGNVLGRISRSFLNRGDLTAQVYYDHLSRDDVVHTETRDTFDVDFQHRFPVRSSHEFIWGAGYRFTTDDLSGIVAFTPSTRGDHLASAFLQDEMFLLKRRLRLTIGSKFEQNSYTGFEIQPNARILWLPNRRHSFWAAISRAVRTPARFEDNARIEALAVRTPEGLTAISILKGNPDALSEHLIAYEAGYRVQPRRDVNFDFAFFFNDYDDLRTFEPGNPNIIFTRPPHVEITLTPQNRMTGHAYGAEVSTNWNPAPFWRLSGAYSWLHMDLELDPSSSDPLSITVEGDTPRHQFHVRSQTDLPKNFEFDLALYYVDELFNQDVPGYVRLDARVGWMLRKDVELSLVLQNLLDDRHPEFGNSTLVVSTQVQRSIYGKITLHF
jgi:iron complex outermembrane recepter protein